VTEALATLQNLFTFAFVVSSMLAMGLSLTVGQIIEPLRNLRLVILALVANFVIVPATAFLLGQLIPMDDELRIGLILLGAAAGAPFLPKLAQIAKANLPFAVGLMALLIVATVIYLPLVLPLLLPGVEVDAAQIAISLFGQMLVPLGIGLLVRARWAEAAGELQRPTAQVSNLSLVLLLVLMLGLNLDDVIGLFGSGAIIATLVLVAVSIGSGYLLGGPGRDTRQVLAMGTGQRNLAATFLIAGSNFADQPNVLVFLAGAGLIGMVLVMPLAAEFGKHATAQVSDASIADPVVAGAGERSP
jgi:BASS family bile acid:Na+ symporter